MYKAKVCGPDHCNAVAATGMDQQTCEDVLTREFNVPVVPYCLNEGVRTLREGLGCDDLSEATPAGKCRLSDRLASICVPAVLECGEELRSQENVL